MDKMSSCHRLWPPYGQFKGRRSITIPWAMPPFLASFKFLGLTAKEHDKHDNDKAAMPTMKATSATVTEAMPTTRMVMMMATTMTVKWTVMAAETMMTTNMTSTTTTTGRQQCNGDDNNGMTTM